ncbi:hypothetical protein SAMN04487948_1405 [Halogranum amylolyticum]|uniref:Uncharacterized protein n=1 Tax=Halogranum amylolyticum TaxID=660520 RepID=A0A1H8WSB1_9EURY|nr:hypothetical protein [Halogranum amylolyticum]SEP30541.1 hypothetical protein SAMN04487948_1405 [Halogranum amylolyticum]
MNAANRGRWVAPDGREWSDLLLQLALDRGEFELVIRSAEAYVVRTRDGEHLHLVFVSYQTVDQGESRP